MNKYLEKAAELREDLTGRVGRAKKPLAPLKPGSELKNGAKTLFAKALVKRAYAPQSRGQPTENASGGVAVRRDRTNAMLMSKVDSDHMKEIRETGIIGAIGAGTGLLGTKILDRMGPKTLSTGKGLTPYVGKGERFLKGLKGNAKTMAVMGGLGLAGDYAAIKINKAFGKHDK